MSQASDPTQRAVDTLQTHYEEARPLIMKWAVAEELAPPTVSFALGAVTALQRGRTAAPETDPVRPVSDAVVDSTLPHLNRHVRGLVEFQRFTIRFNQRTHFPRLIYECNLRSSARECFNSHRSCSRA